MFHLTVFSYLQAFAQLLQAPNDDAQMIIRERFPVPRLVVCDQHGSQVSTFIYFVFCLATVPHSKTFRFVSCAYSYDIR